MAPLVEFRARRHNALWGKNGQKTDACKWKDARVSEAASVCGVSVAAERHKKRGEPCVVSVLN